MDYAKEAIRLHGERRGKIRVVSNVTIENKTDLALAYTPGVAAPCLEIEKNPQKSYEYTRKGNLVAVVTDGSAVLGLGDIGAAAAMPVMEGKCALFSRFGGVDAVPICVDSRDVDEIVNTVALISKSFGGINLEDISAPRCFEIERRLADICDIPIFHDDQHGTAIVAGAALINALRVVGKDMRCARIVINGAGAAGIAIARFLIGLGAENIVLCDRFGALFVGCEKMNAAQADIARVTNRGGERGGLDAVIQNADVFVGVSVGGCLSAAHVAKMAADAVVFAMANPVPEIMPDVAIGAGARVVGTGRSDFCNQINNLLAFPAIFRGAFDAGARSITPKMMLACAKAIADAVGDRLCESFIIPDVFDERVHMAAAEAVRKS